MAQNVTLMDGVRLPWKNLLTQTLKSYSLKALKRNDEFRWDRLPVQYCWWKNLARGSVRNMMYNRLFVLWWTEDGRILHVTAWCARWRITGKVKDWGWQRDMNGLPGICQNICMCSMAKAAWVLELWAFEEFRWWRCYWRLKSRISGAQSRKRKKVQEHAGAGWPQDRQAQRPT